MLQAVEVLQEVLVLRLTGGRCGGWIWCGESLLGLVCGGGRRLGLEIAVEDSVGGRC